MQQASIAFTIEKEENEAGGSKDLHCCRRWVASHVGDGRQRCLAACSQRIAAALIYTGLLLLLFIPCRN